MSITKVSEKNSPAVRAAFLEKELKTNGFSNISWVDTTGSTNADLLEEALNGAPTLSVVIADHQTDGRGRRDRKWISEKDSALLMSVLFRVTESSHPLGTYSMKLSLSACHALHEYGFSNVRIKWPNDLIGNSTTGKKKLAGVLAQSVVKAHETLVVVGIGINVFLGNLNESLSGQEITALSELGDPPDRVALTAKILKNLALLERNEEEILDNYKLLSDTIGQNVRVKTEKEEITGVALDVTSSGSLIIGRADGNRNEIFVGDVINLRQ